VIAATAAARCRRPRGWSCFNAPYDWARVLRFFSGRAIPGVEQVADGVYRRVVELNGDAGRLTVSKHPRRHCLIATVDGAAARHVDGVFARRVARCSTSLPIRPRSAAGSRAIRGSRRSSTPRRGCACRAHGRDSSWRCVRSSASR
jgi:hypothetical protein